MLDDKNSVSLCGRLARVFAVWLLCDVHQLTTIWKAVIGGQHLLARDMGLRIVHAAVFLRGAATSDGVFSSGASDV